ncbi:hypothetical protein PUNSTDRAFT_137485 [Punctularia strigosozonata HHB-11173 SS5]|uniref:uncharacterized protein n=1 Tax=Punctularia strigosozonata (strain HHB-11173) TaxID=741275 RepID=UPI0004416724|nr:uncharacterized protein PUNSTDRAFT_137485 [Punctularia strigosozonata HHB-11173 SS5]EIN05370.1 hypothetical protein PUNSTDRAFT_137485 [Punctularia strigosozonata HHB-11173 SS5]
MSLALMTLAYAVVAVPASTPSADPSGTITDTVIPATFTATRKYFVLTDEHPGMVEVTSTVTWTVTALPSSTGA